MTYTTIESQKICYNLYQNPTAKRLYIFLHGWGGSQKSFTPLAQAIAQTHSTLIFDWPGFGQSDAPKTDWDTHQYAHFFKQFIDSFDFQDFEEIVLYGHSFGCRVMVRYLNEQKFSSKIKHLVFTGAAGIVFPLPWYKKVIKTGTAYVKPLKKLIPVSVQSFIRRKIFRAHDWDATQGTMKQTFLNVIAEPDFRFELETIKIPSTIIWGKNDTYTPLKAAFVYQKHLPTVKQLRVFENGRHGIHHTHAKEIKEIITNL
ncbi:hypothetical protein CSB37_03615 [bacterium DOLZORAL124_38_8]|nr:MAG: hypothetical protein CSB37_03615 [bacterium DOLZORAL124_38_8]